MLSIKKLKRLSNLGIIFYYDEKYIKETQKYFILETFFGSKRFFIGSFEGDDLRLLVSGHNGLKSIGVIEDASNINQLIDGLIFFLSYSITEDNPCIDKLLTIPNHLLGVEVCKCSILNKFKTHFSLTNFKRVLKEEVLCDRENVSIKIVGTRLIVTKLDNTGKRAYILILDTLAFVDESKSFFKSVTFFNKNFTEINMKISLSDILKEYRDIIKQKKLILKGKI